jgi:hypothetical protein
VTLHTHLAVTVNLDEVVIAEEGKSYAIRFRRQDGTVVLSAVTLPATAVEFRSVTLATPLAVLNEDDLFCFGDSTTTPSRLSSQRSIRKPTSVRS